MITVRDVTEAMEKWAPASLAETWDNSGLLIGDPDEQVTAALIALDVTENVLDYAIGNGVSLIVSHHPPIFKPFSRLTGSKPAVRVIRKAIRENIAIFSAHTNLDQVPGGVSHSAADRIGLRSMTILSPVVSGMVKFVTFTPPGFTDRIRAAASAAGAGIIGDYTRCSFSVRGVGTFLPSDTAHPWTGTTGALSHSEEDRIEMIVPSPLVADVTAAVRNAHPHEEMAFDLIPLSNPGSPYGYGVIGDLPESMGGDAFITHVAKSLKTPSVTVSGEIDRTIRRVAVMGGSGGKFIGQAVSAGADAFITGDLGHHDFLDAPDSILLVDATHRATELPVLWSIERELKSRMAEKIETMIYHGEKTPTTRVCNLTPCEESTPEDTA